MVSNKLARAVKTWTRACDKRLDRLISYMHFTSEFKQHCHVGMPDNNADWDCFRTLTLSEILKTQNRLREEFCACLAVTHMFP